MKCKVKDCENHSDEGVFIGFLCMPCYTFLNTGEGKYSQLYRNTVAAEREACADMVLTLTCMGNAKECFEVAATYIRARGLQELNKEAEKNGEPL